MKNKLCYTYARINGKGNFKAIDIDECKFVGNLIYATFVVNNDENQKHLQILADMNKHISLEIQLRNPETKKILFRTELNS